MRSRWRDQRSGFGRLICRLTYCVDNSSLWSYPPECCHTRLRARSHIHVRGHSM
ncbi:hypothetical protein T484DRAFT_1956198 [Baffinella frigidus]|nr:hypothetical protein T484DRAFT_1956198 [Cryptophyta sp. CCMP2293]